ncbi:MAG: ABC transporter ATP-binding protein, partial [Hyphomicrobiales bacterium]|nr:ABC transporter ATP-binding protein [Hyphomicrobiales bacterium]
MSDAITVSGLDVRFGASHVVKDVRFTVGEGESYGIVGESGSGKSTILRALSGLNREWSGSITIAGEPQKARRPPAFHRQVQMVFQDPYGSLHPRMTVDATLAEPVAIHGLGDADKRINRALADVGLDGGFRFRYPHQLSGGQRQRVAIARALILEPAILLLDEPTSALDVSIQAEVLNLLSDLKGARGLTLVLVSHNLAVVGHLCGRVAVMKEGRIVEEATLEA